MRILFLLLLSFYGFADDWDNFIDRQNQFNKGLIEYYDSCGRILINANYGKECDENYTGGWENPEDTKKLRNQAEKCSLSPEYYDAKNSEVVICNPLRLFNKNIYNPDLPPLTESSTSKIEDLANKICVANNKPKIEDDLPVIQNQLVIAIKCGLTNSEKRQLKKREKEEALKQQLKLKKKENEKLKEKLNPLKTQCQELGFKEGSKKFKDCVVELME